MSNDPDSSEDALKELSPTYLTRDEIDIGLLEDSLSKTPWERMLANDDALNFAESLRAAMGKRDAKS
jgi:hypothetical protein